MCIKKLLILGLLSVQALSSSAFAGFLNAGGYVGSQNGEEKVDLLLKNAPGREGSFLAVFVKDLPAKNPKDDSTKGKKISLYLVDEINASSYSMTPLVVTPEGDIGVINDDPSLVISSATNSRGKSIFKIMSSNSGNDVGFSGFFEFEGKNSKLNWVSFSDGQYEIDENPNALQLSPIDPIERESTAVFLTKTLSGNFTLKEKFPSMFTLNKNKMTAIGTKMSETPNSIGIFLQKKGFLNNKTTYLHLINPKDDVDVKTFTKK